MNIQGKKVFLRAVEESDLPLLHKWSNDPATQDIMGAIHFPSSLDWHKSWFQNLKSDQMNQRFAIDAPELGLIGLSTIINIDWRNNHAWHGIILGDKDIRGKGYGFDTVMTTLRYAFDELHMERLDGAMIEYNEVSINLYINKCGWKKEGVKKNFYFRKGRYWDQVIVGITRQDYYDHIEKIGYWAT